MGVNITQKSDLYTQSAVLTRISVIIDDLNQGSARKEPKNQHKEPNFMDILIKFEKNTLISDVLSRIIFRTKKSPPTMKRESDFYTQSAVLTRISVIITFVIVIITLILVNFVFCVYKSYYACKNHTMRVNIVMVLIRR
jgi:hypothetical protein